MTLPGLSSLMYVARLRCIQSIHEPPDRRNPDTRVRRFLPLLERWRASWIGRDELARLRKDPFYYYLIARTRYYDEVLRAAVVDGVRRIVNVGCGSDTRAYRFRHLLRSRGATVLECDQLELIAAKRRMVKWWRGLDHVEYLSIDLNDGAWPALEQALRARTDSKVLVLMEGVSPYVDASAFGRFLQLLSTTLSPGSHVAYDFKLRGVDDGFGRAGRTETPFRLPRDKDEVIAFHRAHGLRLERLESSAALCARLLPAVVEPNVLLFDEDSLVRLDVARGQRGKYPGREPENFPAFGILKTIKKSGIAEEKKRNREPN
jgi:methyltransferase (TIGR00027 family)